LTPFKVATSLVSVSLEQLTEVIPLRAVHFNDFPDSGIKNVSTGKLMTKTSPELILIPEKKLTKYLAPTPLVVLYASALNELI
jgi:hypothetical protein